MREYKFRSWDAKGTFNKGIPCMHEDVTGSTMFDYIWHSDEFPKMQFVGLTDRNGKDVYEGDVLSNGQHIHWIVIFEDASFKVKFPEPINTQRFVLARWMAESREIIGNIYENSELINS